MSDLISREAKNSIDDVIALLNSINSEGKMDYAVYSELYDAVSSIDAVPVVRCKNCRYRDECYRLPSDIIPNGFCERGER